METSLDDLRHSYARSDFEKLLFSCLPREKSSNATRTMDYTVGNGEATQINNIRTAVRENVVNDDGNDPFWTDGGKLKKQIQDGAKFDLDLYLHFHQGVDMTLGQLLGEAGAMVEPIAGHYRDGANGVAVTPMTDAKSIPINDGTHVWMEICTDPTKARHKFFQLLRAHYVLNPYPTATVIAAICLNERWDNARIAAQLLRESSHVRAQTNNRMALVIVWTENRNLFTSLFRVRDDLKRLTYAFYVLVVAVVFLAFAFFAFQKRFDSIDQRFDSIDQRFDSIDQTLKALAERRGPMKFLQNLVRNSRGVSDDL